MPPDVMPHPDDRDVPGAVLELLGGVLNQMKGNADDMVGDIAGEVVRRVPGLAADELVLDAIARTSRANIAMVLDLLSEPDLPLQAAPGAVALANAFVRADQPLSALIEAYHVGQQLFFDRWLAGLGGATGDAALLAQATLWSYRRICAYLDMVLTRTSEQFLLEQRRRNELRAARQWHVVQSLLEHAADGSAETAASAALGYDIAGTHVAAVIGRATGTREFSAEPATDEATLRAAATAIARHLGAARAFAVPAAPGLLYAWIPADTAGVGTIDLPPGLRASLGTPQRGADGFRVSHLQATWAHHLARTADGLSAVVHYSAVAVVSLLREDPEQIRCFVLEQLGGLAGRDAATRDLRETVRIALEEGLNASRAAGRLSLHKNTVLYRLRGAEELRGRQLTDGRLELELALRILDVFGEPLLLT